ncbi:MAG: hypothetical protein JNK72_18320 [Myxococcales bacterium]|nr:hypothetical protein [Myxococcales bacterium]
MSTQTPLMQAKSLAGSKKDLVEKVKALATEAYWVDRTGERGLAGLSNAKLLRLHTVLTTVAKRFASRAALIEAVATAQGHGKDGDYKKSLEKHPLPRLWDALQSAERRAKKAKKAS